MANAPNAQTSVASRVFARVFRPFAKVEPEETFSVAVLTLTIFLIMMAYYFLKTAREPLVLLYGGAEVKSYASAAQATVLLLALPLYNALVKHVSRMRLLTTVYLFFVSNLILFTLLPASTIAVAFFVWVGVFNMMAVSQAWGFAADIYKPEQGKRLFAIIGVGGSSGAYAGSRIAKTAAALGPQKLMLAASATLVVVVLLFAWVNRSVEPAEEVQKKEETHAEGGIPEQHAAEGTFALFMRDKYLLLAGALSLLVNWVNSNGEYILDRTLLASLGDAPMEQKITFVGSFKGDYFSWVNLVGFLLQLFVVSRVLTKLGPRVALYFLPGVAFIGYTIMLTAPILSLIRIAKISENSLDYSIEKTSFQALFLVASRIEKYVGKMTVETFLVRMGDVFSAGLVWVASMLALSTPAMAGINMALIAIWVVVVFAIGKEHKRRSEESEEMLALEPIRT
ncbi:hypothetical protein LZC95_42755 [Pendulispora brunnea]|uniref:ADP,ATP carrier protein n=1 Tax=Pendulispora brunnea TaxID=2905690 RepID=A0ABZ2K367_9BACT